MLASLTMPCGINTLVPTMVQRVHTDTHTHTDEHTDKQQTAIECLMDRTWRLSTLPTILYRGQWHKMPQFVTTGTYGRLMSEGRAVEALTVSAIHNVQ